uniref:Uncharacterized protein n=1 Tax=Moniliophthora roreri TaxID=221103 RepID=A0A0W0FND5_MONRR
MFRPSFFLLSVLAKRTLSLAPGDLTVSLKAVSPSVPSVDNITITAIVSNPTASDLRVLAANNILDTSATKSFDIKAADGRRSSTCWCYGFVRLWPRFSLLDSSSRQLGCTQLQHQHLLRLFVPRSRHYLFYYPISARASTIQSSLEDSSPLKIETNTVEVTVTSVPERGELDERTSTPMCSDGGKRQTIADSLRYAKSLAGGAATDIQTHPNGPQYERYFGRNSQPEIWWNLDVVAGDLTSDRK